MLGVGGGRSVGDPTAAAAGWFGPTKVILEFVYFFAGCASGVNDCHYIRTNLGGAGSSSETGAPRGKW